jgi:hypothetical protein
VDGRQIRSGLGKLRRIVGRAEDLLTENKTLKAQVRRLERELRAVQAGLAALDGNRGRRRASSATSTRRTRRPVTDPAVLERRRQALEKARRVRAEKRAAAAGSR